MNLLNIIKCMWTTRRKFATVLT